MSVKQAWPWALIAGLALAPLAATPYFLHVAIVVLMNITYTAAVYSVLRMGYLSLGHAGFMAIGAYVTAIATVKLGLSPWLGLALAGPIAAAFAWGLGAVTLKLRGIYFSLAIFAFGEIVNALARASDWLGGPAGMAGVPRPSFFGVPLASHASFYYLVAIVAVGSLAALYRLEHTRYGRTLLTLKTGDSERLAASVGVDAARYKNIAFTLSAFIAGLMGAVHAHYLMFISPSVFTFFHSTDLLIYSMIGGLANFWGPVLGAGVLTALGEQLFSAGYWKTFVYASILIVVILALPGGLIDLPNAWKRRRARRAGEVAP
jgi:branched-chain amino acid transport system permease protein